MNPWFDSFSSAITSCAEIEQRYRRVEGLREEASAPFTWKELVGRLNHN